MVQLLKIKTYQNIVNKKIANPNNKNIYNIGFFGIGKYESSKFPKIYAIWHSILRRCYSEEQQIKQPTYIGCYVCDKWHNFQNFAEWYELNYIDTFEIDKDILFKGNKIYSPETCSFVPQEINALFTKTNKLRGNYPIGVTPQNSKYRASLSIDKKQYHLGVRDTIEEAFILYKTEKKKNMKNMANRWKHILPEKTYMAIYNYNVEITD